MCSIFGINEKFDAKLEELVKKMEERLADMEDKQDSDYESNRRKFSELEDKVEDLNLSLSDQQKRHEEHIGELRQQLELSNSKHKELQLRVDLLEQTLEASVQHKDNREEISGHSNLAADIEVLREKVHQQSGEKFQNVTNFPRGDNNNRSLLTVSGYSNSQ